MAETLDQLAPENPKLMLDKERTLKLNWYAWKHLERHYGSFIGVWSVLLRLVNSTAASAYLRSLVGAQAEETLAAAKILADQGPVMDDIALVLWACCLEDATDRGEKLLIPHIERTLRPHRMAEYLDAIKTAIEAATPPTNPPTPAPGAEK